jgi:hypothetical protein
MAIFYVRILFDQIPQNHKIRKVFREDRNYPVLAVDPGENRFLIPDDRNRFVWAPAQAFAFVKVKN